MAFNQFPFKRFSANVEPFTWRWNREDVTAHMPSWYHPNGSAWLFHCSPKTSGELSPSRLCFVRGESFRYEKDPFESEPSDGDEKVLYFEARPLIVYIAPKLALPHDRTPSMPFSPEKRENSHELCLSPLA